MAQALNPITAGQCAILGASVGDLCVSTDWRAGELCVYKERSRNRGFGCGMRDPRISSDRLPALGAGFCGAKLSALALGSSLPGSLMVSKDCLQY
jgi:hypothetical protein